MMIPYRVYLGKDQLDVGAACPQCDHPAGSPGSLERHSVRCPNGGQRHYMHAGLVSVIVAILLMAGVPKSSIILEKKGLRSCDHTRPGDIVASRCSQTRVRPPRASARPRHGRGLASSLPVPAHGFLCFSCRGQSAAPIVSGKTYMTHQTDICERYRITLRCGPPISHPSCCTNSMPEIFCAESMHFTGLYSSFM